MPDATSAWRRSFLFVAPASERGIWLEYLIEWTFQQVRKALAMIVFCTVCPQEKHRHAGMVLDGGVAELWQASCCRVLQGGPFC